MYILGIETSCDETAASVVRDGQDVLSNIVASSLKDHSLYGGIIPEIASRRQLEVINQVVKTTLKKASVTLKQIDAIAVTKSPGLIGSLLVGISYAQALSLATGKKLIEVDHVKAHLYANFLKYTSSLRKKKTFSEKLPAIGLIVSGGHTSLFYMKDLIQYKLLGETRDDAAGEAFDKVARILDLGYPGGPIIDKLAQKRSSSDIKFTCAELPHTFDFSFSGIKTAVLYHYQKNCHSHMFSKASVAYAFQESVVSILVKKCLWACQKKKTKTIFIGGGVAANSMLRRRLHSEAKKFNINVFFPPVEFCMDNGAMIAGWAFLAQKKS